MVNALNCDFLYRRERQKLQLFREQANILAFRGAISNISSRNHILQDTLQKFTQTLVDYLDAAFARIWLLNVDKSVLELQASSGIYTHIDGGHQFVPVGKFKIGLIAQEKQPHLTNDVFNDLRVGDKEWAKREQMIAFAGYPLLLGEELVGVIAMFSRKTLSEPTLDALSLVSSEISICIRNIQAENAIKKKTQELEEALQELQQAQLQIVQSEKMSALGNLVAGIAHEINNPLGFIAGNLTEVKIGLKGISEHLQMYRSGASTSEIAEHAEKIDIDYLLEDAPKIIDSMQLGCDRIQSISTSLRIFSRADKDYQVPFNVHEGIDSTILILKHRLKASSNRPAIEVVTNYGEIPSTKCFPGQLNQVFMNLLANAIDAIEESYRRNQLEQIIAYSGVITIATSIYQDKYVQIQITDNGIGMEEAIKVHIFENLFTTKPVGKGTGLGLAIVKKIVEEKHHGKLSCTSTFNVGTEFLIQLPI